MVGLAVTPASAGMIHERPPEWPTSGAAREADFKLYDHVVAVREAHRADFDRRHPFYGHMLREERFLESVDARWHAHPARFVHADRFLVRFLDGHELHRARMSPPPLGDVLTPVVCLGGLQPGPSPGPPPGDRPPGVGPPVFTPAPEPSAWVLVVVASGLLLPWIAQRSRARTDPSARDALR
jgi:hypothetical protein